jgi:hypothetical protein
MTRGCRRPLAALLLVACVAGPARAGDAEDIVAMLAGEYDNARHRAAEAGGPAASVPGKQLIKAPPRYLIVRPVDLPNIFGVTVYLEWRDTAKTGPVTTERIWAFADTKDGLEMRFYTLLPSGREKLWGLAQGVEDAAARAATLTMDDVFGYHERCVFKFARTAEGFAGKLPSGACVMLQRSKNAYMTVEALVEVTPNRLREYTEFDYSRPGMTDEYEDRVYDRVR